MSDPSGTQEGQSSAPGQGAPERSGGQTEGSHPRPYTLSIDIGGTGLKASVLDARGQMVADRVRTATTYPMAPTEATVSGLTVDAGKGRDAKGGDGKGHDGKGHDGKGHDAKGNGGSGHEGNGNGNGNGNGHRGGGNDRKATSGMVETLARLVAPLPVADRVSAGFPGMVRRGRILSAPHFVTVSGPGSEVDPDLEKVWKGFDLAEALGAALKMPARVANDADVQGAAVVAGTGLELVLTLGTGYGTAVFMDGHLLPHLEIAHQPFRKGESYNEQLGEPARKRIGDGEWNDRVRKAIALMDEMFFFDHLYLGGGNARRVVRDDLGPVLERTTVVDNAAGILGGIKLWEGTHLAL